MYMYIYRGIPRDAVGRCRVPLEGSGVEEETRRVGGIFRFGIQGLV